MSVVKRTQVDLSLFPCYFASEVEVDHIIPKSKSFDDSMSNKVLCICEANRYQKPQTGVLSFW